VLANDYSAVRSRFFQNTTTPNFTVFHDTDGSGSIVANDFSAVKARFFDNLPPPQTAAARLDRRCVTADLLASGSLI
jgi:hypothetical protein